VLHGCGVVASQGFKAFTAKVAEKDKEQQEKTLRKIQKILVIVMLSIAPLSIAFAGDATGQTATIAVDGLSCPFCAYGLEKNLKKVKGIESVSIDMKTGHAIVALKQGVQVNDQTLRQAVKKAGFTARDIERQ